MKLNNNKTTETAMGAIRVNVLLLQLIFLSNTLIRKQTHTHKIIFSFDDSNAFLIKFGENVSDSYVKLSVLDQFYSQKSF